jgi:hypothetical protein
VHLAFSSRVSTCRSCSFHAHSPHLDALVAVNSSPLPLPRASTTITTSHTEQPVRLCLPSIQSTSSNTVTAHHLTSAYTSASVLSSAKSMLTRLNHSCCNPHRRTTTPLTPPRQSSACTPARSRLMDPRPVVIQT